MAVRSCVMLMLLSLVSGQNESQAYLDELYLSSLILASSSENGQDNVAALHLRGSGRCTQAYHHNCMSATTCCDQSLKCYEKHAGLAVCLNSCTPGIHSNDPPQWQTPWTCRQMGASPSPPVPPPLPPASCVVSYTESCLQNPVCCDPSTKCYEKNSAVAICLPSCSPGVHDSDPLRWRTPWSCRQIGGLPAAPAPPLPAAPAPPQPAAPAPPPAAATCSVDHVDDCLNNPTCCSESSKCYQKNDFYATCLPSCTPGIHYDDPPKYRTPWSCKAIEPPSSSPLEPDPALLQPSSAAVLTFYMYRAQSSTSYPPSNVNTGNLAGVMWYIQNEVVSGAYGQGNKFGISRIVRYKVQTKATQPLLEQRMNFGVRVAFDAGECTGPSCELSWARYGYNVGCNNLGSYPYPQFDTHYPGGVWYSLPGQCPSMPYDSQTAACEEQEPGGLCDDIPTGTGTCTWSYTDDGEEISLEELYEHANTTADAFWANADDDDANSHKLKLAQEVFEQKYGKDEFPNPPCDFNYNDFYR